MAGKPKEAEDTEDDVVDAEVIESGEELEWGETHEEARVQVAGVTLVITGPYEPGYVTGRTSGTVCMAMDRRREQREDNRTAVGEMSFPATLGALFCLNDLAWEVVVNWKDYKRRASVVPYKDVEFLDEMGRGFREKRKTRLLKDEQEPVRGRKQVKAGHGKAKARKDFKRMMYQTSNKEYNDIQEMLNDENVSNEDARKKLTEMEENMDSEEIVI